jgi:hypothetical protein
MLGVHSSSQTSGFTEHKMRLKDFHDRQIHRDVKGDSTSLFKIKLFLYWSGDLRNIIKTII